MAPLRNRLLLLEFQFLCEVGATSAKINSLVVSVLYSLNISSGSTPLYLDLLIFSHDTTTASPVFLCTALFFFKSFKTYHYRIEYFMNNDTHPVFRPCQHSGIAQCLWLCSCAPLPFLVLEVVWTVPVPAIAPKNAKNGWQTVRNINVKQLKKWKSNWFMWRKCAVWLVIQIVGKVPQF